MAPMKSRASVTDLVDKSYRDEASKPLWGVENAGERFKNAKPLWGLVNPDHESDVNLFTLRKESLWLPGFNSRARGVLNRGYQNLPGVDFYSDVLTDMYNMGSLLKGTDYSGKSNLAMYRLWQDLSRTPTSAARILNLIWTDIAANAVVGTKSIASEMELRAGDDATAVARDASMIPVIVYRKPVRYRLPYATPAICLLVCTLCIILAASVLTLLGRTGPFEMRQYLNETSAGRLLASSLYAHGPGGELAVGVEKSASKWISTAGMKQITLGSGTAMAAESGTELGKVSLLGTPQAEPLWNGGEQYFGERDDYFNGRQL